MEVKLNLISHIERKIRTQASMLKVVLSWRLLIENHLQKLQSKLKTLI